MWDLAIGSVNERLPKFNKYTLKGYREDQVKRFPDFINTVFQEAVQLFEGKLQYLGYRVLSPEKRLSYNIDNKLIKGKVNIQQSELELYEYMFEFEGQQIPVHLYLPYLFNGNLVINDTRYHILNAIIERVIYRVADGVLIKVMRSPIQFWRSEQFHYKSTDGTSYNDAVITVNVYFKASPAKLKTPLILYLLSNFGFDKTTEKLGLPQGAVSFISELDEDPDYAYFNCTQDVFLKVNKESILTDVSCRRFVASLLYILQMVKRYTIVNVFDMTFYKMILGKILHGTATPEELAVNHSVGHLQSLKTYLDKYTQNELRLMNIYCDDIYDLFVTVYFNIDQWLVSYSPNDLFEKRIGGAELILIEIVKNVFLRFYDTLRRHKVINADHIKSMLRMDPMKCTSALWSNTSLQVCSSMYNDNTLIGMMARKVRQSAAQENTRQKNVNLIGAKEHQFHPSMIAIESALSISSSSPGTTGDINPYVAIDKIGCFRKEAMPWYSDIEPLSKYLVQV